MGSLFPETITASNTATTTANISSSIKNDSQTMALTYQQLKLMRGTIPVLQEHGEHIATVFYKTMLKEHPDLNNFFNAVNMKLGSQPRALCKLILAFASNISHISELVPMLERVAHKHTSLGIKPEHYDIVCKYLMRAFSAVLGPTMTSEVRLAWTKAYWVLANMLINREAQLYQNFENWPGWRRFIVDKKTCETKEGDIYSFELKPVDGAPLPPYMPGQYVSLRVRVPGSGYLQCRQYTLSDKPSSDHYRITVRKIQERLEPSSVENVQLSPVQWRPPTSTSPANNSHSRTSSFSTAVESTGGDSFLGIMDHGVRKRGVVSSLLVDDILEGDVLELSRPAGDIYLDLDNDSSSTPVVLISSGVGVSPNLSMLNTIVEKDPVRPITWLQGSHFSIPFEEHVMNLAKQRSDIRVTFFNTGIGKKDIVDTGDNIGYYLEWFKAEDMYFENKSTRYFICGPEKFLTDITNYLVLNGVALSQILYELHATGSFEMMKDSASAAAVASAAASSAGSIRSNTPRQSHSGSLRS
jgi:nitric oxide dioxygenase